MNIRGNITYIIAFILILHLSCCIDWQEKTVIITKDYLINPNWSEVDNDLKVSKMRFKDSTQRIDPKNATDFNLYNGLVKDTTLVYYGNVEYNGEEYTNRKIYFNKYNGFLWYKDLFHSEPGERTLGEFQKNTWYMLAGLSNVGTLYYLYTDSAGKFHQFKVINMTNY